MPSVRLAHSSSGVVRHSSSTRSASNAFDVHSRIELPGELMLCVALRPVHVVEPDTDAPYRLPNEFLVRIGAEVHALVSTTRSVPKRVCRAVRGIRPGPVRGLPEDKGFKGKFPSD